MNTIRVCSILVVMSLQASAQVVPTTPTKFGKRAIGTGTSSTSSFSNSGTGSATTGATLPKTEPVVRTTTYISLSGARQWTSTDGKPLLAKLIAYEDITTEVLKSDAANANTKPVMPAKPTVIKDGKVRLLVNKTPFEVALDKLSQADQDFVNTVQRAVAATK